jgi:hypothetical protein
VWPRLEAHPGVFKAAPLARPEPSKVADPPIGANAATAMPVPLSHRFCRSCGNFAILTAIRRASCRRSPPRLILEIDIAKLLPATVADNKAGVQFLDSPGRREAALRQCSPSCTTSHNHSVTVQRITKPSAAAPITTTAPRKDLRSGPGGVVDLCSDGASRLSSGVLSA